MTVATSSAARRYSSILELIGNTPLIRLASFETGLRNVELYAKAEWKNPGGSVKDRPAARMIADAERSGALTRDKIILDATSGNTGIAYAMIGAASGYRVRLCMPENVTPERKKVLRAFGAEVVFTSPMDGSDGAIIKAREMYAANPERYFYPDQYNNDGNWRSHFDTTGPEILEQTEGRLTHFVAGLGTSGTFVGVGRRLPAAAFDSLVERVGDVRVAWDAEAEVVPLRSVSHVVCEAGVVERDDADMRPECPLAHELLG